MKIGKINFCTLFNSFYLSRGVLMYRSLEKSCADFHLYVYAFDQDTYEFLKNENYKHLTVISLKEFEDEELLRVKKDRTAAEYCWTCSSATILHAIENFKLDNCTYIDADMYFYSDPRVLIDEMGENSVLITEHRYTPKYDQSKVSGKYCVQFVTFKNDENGLKVLKDWKKNCIAWCYNRVEDGKFGDQKYLDAWKGNFKGVHELQHLGGGLAPWNMLQYGFSKNSSGKLIGKENSSGKTFDVVFFHFHGLKLYSDDIVSFTGDGYEMNPGAAEIFFKPYVKELVEVSFQIHKKVNNKFNSNGAVSASPKKPFSAFDKLHFYQYDVRQSLKNISGERTKERVLHHHFFYLKDL